MKGARVGEFVEIKTQGGLAYAHYVLRHGHKPAWGDLVHVLPGLHRTRPDDLVERAYAPHLFVTFFPVAQAARENFVEVVGFAEPTKAQATLPTFRQLQLLCEDSRPRWSLWDGRRHWLVDALTAEQRQFPRGPSVGNLPALVDEILFRNGVITPDRREWLDKKRETLEPMASAYTENGDYPSAANLYIELLDTAPGDKALQQALAAACRSFI